MEAKNPYLYLNYEDLRALKKLDIECDVNTKKELTYENLVKHIKYLAHPLDLDSSYAEQVDRKNIKLLSFLVLVKKNFKMMSL